MLHFVVRCGVVWCGEVRFSGCGQGRGGVTSEAFFTILVNLVPKIEKKIRPLNCTDILKKLITALHG